MKTKMIASIDISALLDAIGPDAIPSERDINAAVRKRLTNAQISLRDLGECEPIQKDDALTVSVTGPTPRFNKAKLPLTVGNHLYSAALEDALIGARIGESRTVALEDGEVTATILSARRKSAPEPDDGMVEAQGIENVHTVDEYRKWLGGQMLSAALSNVIYNKIGEAVESGIQYPEIDPADLDAMAEPYRAFILEYMQANEKVDPENLTPEEFEKITGSRNLEELSRKAREHFPQQIRDCMFLAAIAGLEITGDCDPTVSYRASANLYEKARTYVLAELERRRK